MVPAKWGNWLTKINFAEKYVKKAKIVIGIVAYFVCFFSSRNSRSKHERHFSFFRESFRSMETLDQVEKRGSTQSGNSNISRFYNFFPLGPREFF